MSVRNLGKLFAPRSVALIGASDRPGSLGATLLRNLTAGGFGGAIHPVNPNHTELAGLRVVASVADLAAARASGFTYDREEHALGVCAIGTPIRVNGWPAHAISIAVPASRFEANLPQLQAALRQAQASIELKLS